MGVFWEGTAIRQSRLTFACARVKVRVGYLHEPPENQYNILICAVRLYLKLGPSDLKGYL